MAKKKSDNLKMALARIVVLLLIALIIALSYGGTHGWFKSNIFGGDTYINQTTIEQLQQPPTGTCSLSFNKNPVCVGDTVIGFASGRPNEACHLYYTTDGGTTWTADPVYGSFTLNMGGTYSASRVAAGVNSYIFGMLCGKEPTDCRASAPLTIQACPETPECSDSDGGAFPLVYGVCKDGTVPFGTSDHCISPTTVAEQYCSPSGMSCAMTQIPCPIGTTCAGGECVPSDGVPPDGGAGDGIDYGGYSSCSAWAGIEGKAFSDEVSGITSLAACEAYADSKCKKINPSWWVTRLDYDTPNCCIWDCSG